MESKKQANKRTHANSGGQNLKQDVFPNSAYSSDMYGMSSSSSSPIIANPGVSNNHHAQNPSQYNASLNQHVSHLNNQHQSLQMNASTHQYSDYYNSMPISNSNGYAGPSSSLPPIQANINYNYAHQQSLAPKITPNLNQITVPIQQQQQQQSTQATGSNRPPSLIPNEQYNLACEQINSSDTFILDDVLDLNFASNELLATTNISSSNSTTATITATSSTTIDDDSFLNFQFQHSQNNSNNNAQSQNMPSLNNPNQNYFPYQNQMLNGPMTGNLPHYAPTQQHIYYNEHQQPRSSSSIPPHNTMYGQQNQQLNGLVTNTFPVVPSNAYGSNSNSCFDLIAEESKGGLLQQLLLD